jgi:hypothetical protein
MEALMKKIDGVSLQKTLAFAALHYRDRTTPVGVNLFEHCKSVAQQAEVIAARLYQDVRADYMPDDTKESIAAIVQGALLHDVLNVSACAFENIAEVSTVQIAAMVADISRDFRLVETKRDMEFRGRLSQSPVSAQVVVVADIICTARDILELLNKSGLAAVPKVKKLLTQLDGDLLAIHAANKYYMLRMFAHAARNMLSEISQTIKACRQKAKLDKIVAQNTKTIRERAEEAQKREKSSPLKGKKKEVRYARKRSTE